MGRRPGSRNRGAVLAGQGAPKLTLRLTPEQLADVQAQGGAAWARQVILEALAGQKRLNAALRQAHNEGWDWADGAEHGGEWKIHLSEVDGQFFLVEVGDFTSVAPLGSDARIARAALAARINAAEEAQN